MQPVFGQQQPQQAQGQPSAFGGGTLFGQGGGMQGGGMGGFGGWQK